MKIKKIGESKIIMSNPMSRHQYFAWPSVARLQNGKIAVVASGYRLSHICPFGKTVISYSEDEGESYTIPAPVIDTPLDDRDGGIAAFGEKGVIVTSFNNSVAFQQKAREHYAGRSYDEYRAAYLDTVSPEEEEKYLGITFRISEDCGVTFGELHKSEVTSPHGPLELPDGSLLWVGRVYRSPEMAEPVDRIEAHRLYPDGKMEFAGAIENIEESGEPTLSCEPHAIRLKDGRILTHIRVQRKGEHRMFTLYQSISEDEGKTWSKPEMILDRLGGAPAHLCYHSSGALISVYGYREQPYGIKAMISMDDGATWDVDHVLFETDISDDIGYPATVELKDGSLLTVFYSRIKEEGPAVIMQQKWSIEK